MAGFKRVNIKEILADPKRRRELVVRSIMNLQEVEGTVTTREQAERAYDEIHKALNGLGSRWDEAIVRLRGENGLS